jgi:hypothetical protein
MALILNGSTGVSLVQPGALPTGSIVQVVTAINNTRFITSSTSFVAANLQCSITPTRASNKILVLVSSHINNNSTAGVQIEYTLFRNGSVNLATAGNANASRFGYAIGISNIRVEVPMSMTYLDSPNTTSSTSYRVYVKASSATDVEIPGATNQIETMTLLEIEA